MTDLCKECKGSSFVRLKGVGLTCTTCKPQNTKDADRYIAKNKLPIKRLSPMVSRSVPMEFKCKECKTIFNKTMNVIEIFTVRGKGLCPTCNVEKQRVDISNTLKRKYKSGEIVATPRKYTPDSYRDYLKKKKLTSIEDYNGTDTSILHKCLVCKHEFKNSPGNIVSQNNGCSSCKGTHKTDATYRTELKARGSIFTPVEKYKGSRVGIDHKCNKCGFIKNMMPTNALKEEGGSYYCPGHSQIPRFSRKIFKLGDRKVSCQGYNTRGIELLLKKGYSPEDIVTEYEKEMPKVYYKYKGWHKYNPDIFIKSTNRILEIKSPPTMGLGLKSNYGRSAAAWYSLCAKYKYCIKQGYNFSLVVYGGYPVTRIPMPKDWYNMKHRDAVKYVINKVQSKTSTSSPA